MRAFDINDGTRFRRSAVTSTRSAEARSGGAESGEGMMRADRTPVRAQLVRRRRGSAAAAARTVAKAKRLRAAAGRCENIITGLPVKLDYA